MIEIELGNKYAETKEEYIKSVIGEAVGAGSTCWESMKGTGTFNSLRAVAIVDKAFEIIWAEINHESA